MNLVNVVVLAHFEEVTDQGVDVAAEGVEVRVGDPPLFAELTNDRGNFVIVDMADSGKEMMLNLVVETAVEDGQPEPADIGRGHHLKNIIGNIKSKG